MPLIHEPASPPRSPRIAITVACLVLLGFAVGGLISASHVAMVPSAVPPSLAVEGDADTTSLSADAHSRVRLSSAGPSWRDITPDQRQVLMPLRDRWSAMGALAKRRWLVLADRYPKMDESERNKLVSRMRTWANLSSQQRNQARLNFESSKRLTAQELQSKWDEYQALSEAEKLRLAEQARKASAAKKAKRKLAQVPPKLQPKSPVVAPPAPPHAPVLIETAPVHAPQASPEVQLKPLPDLPSVSSQPVLVPQLGATVELLPMEPPKPAASTAPSHTPLP